MKTKTMTTISLLCVLGTAWAARADTAPKHSEEEEARTDKLKFGVGVSFSPFNTIVPDIEIPPLQFSDFRLPIFIGSRFKLEPEIGILRLTAQQEATGEFIELFNFLGPEKIEATFTQLRLAVGTYFRHPATEKLEIYVGPRVGIIRNSESMKVNGDRESQTLTHWSFGAGLGGEYFFSSDFSLGGEVRFNYLSLDEPKDFFFSRKESSLLNTNGSVLIRFYF